MNTTKQTNSKLREALTKILNLINSLDEDCAVDPVEIRDIAKTALAEPVKNCEVGSVAEQKKRFKDFCKEGKLSRIDLGAYCAYDCPCRDSYDCKLEWAQMPYREGVPNAE